MISNTNINSDKSEAQLYEVLLYKKKDIIAIQKKLSMFSDPGKGLIESRNQTGETYGKRSLGTLYHLLLYLEENISMIQNVLGIVDHSDQEISGLENSLPLVPLAENDPDEKIGIGKNANQLAVPPDSKLMRKTFADSYELFNEAFADISFGEIFNLLMYLEDNIIAIQEKLGIIGYSNQERAEEADKTA
ncbi:hypothetical protein C1645_835256 [Glomus cerebriforme]|uniref:Uncharacterized protein n=1 Tax=Glomus cerebriforme TaxID=658196 RepID=A0A397S962_9GLOM|nr:hypothetical protein C1645_835256 [Glomus cerebriforme]